MTISSTSNYGALLALLPIIPQLQSLTVETVDYSILAQIRDNLPNLEKLSFFYYHKEPVGTPIHFTSVTELRLHLLRRESNPLPFSFERLESLKLVAHYVDEQITEWLQQNVHLKSFTMERDLDEEHMDRLVAALGRLPNLEWVVLDVRDASKPDKILSKLANVKNVSFTVYGQPLKN